MQASRFWGRGSDSEDDSEDSTTESEEDSDLSDSDSDSSSDSEGARCSPFAPPEPLRCDFAPALDVFHGVRNCGASGAANPGQQSQATV